jgi:hypothetical protein
VPIANSCHDDNQRQQDDEGNENKLDKSIHGAR